MDSLVTAIVICVALACLSLILLEVARSVVDARRVKATGIGGTQDVTIWGLAITAVFLLAAVVLGAIWLALRWSGRV
jgi:hypothetical protein